MKHETDGMPKATTMRKNIVEPADFKGSNKWDHKAVFGEGWRLEGVPELHIDHRSSLHTDDDRAILTNARGQERDANRRDGEPVARRPIRLRPA